MSHRYNIYNQLIRTFTLFSNKSISFIPCLIPSGPETIPEAVVKPIRVPLGVPFFIPLAPSLRKLPRQADTSKVEFLATD